MTDDRDRRAAHECLVDALHCDEMERVSPELESRLAAFRAAARAEGEAEAIEAAAQACEDIAHDPDDSRPVSLALDCRDRIRTLAPPAGWVAVRKDHLADLRVLAEVILSLRDDGCARYSPTDEFAAEIRAALEATR